ncbi:MAG: phosphoribosylamine--glycine ligase [Solirubrobacterales bacterium]
MKVLVLGGGGREHAIVNALARSPSNPEILAAPGTLGIAEVARCLPGLDPTDVPAVVEAARENEVELVVVGPEAPLVAGVVDGLEAAGIRAVGPRAGAAQLEGSKAFAKKVMEEAGVPTARYRVVGDAETAAGVLDEWDFPVVLKADGLAAGKGVLICPDREAADEALGIFFSEKRFGETEVLIEEVLEGEELSLLAICDGERAIPLAPARDFKRIGDGDTGPNTGGMGSFSPVPGVDPGEVGRLSVEVHRPVIDYMALNGEPFHGILYAGLMMTGGGPKVLEYNVRFGDPETQAVLPRLSSDILELFLAASEPGGLEGVEVTFSDDWAVTVVLASAGYPESASSGDVISGLERAAELAEVVHAGTALEDEVVVTGGGRVLNLTGLGPDIATARRRAYDAAEAVQFEGRQMRSDIAAGLEGVDGE